MSRELTSDLSKVANAAATAVRQWEKLPELVKAGRLAKSRGHWYRIIDPTAADEIGYLVQEFELLGPGGTVSRVKLEKPDPKQAEELAALAREQQ